MLRVALLGPPDIRLGSASLAFPTRKAQALLIYLMVEGGMHTREQIISLLWPESSSARGRGVLRTTLSQLRRVLQAGLQSTPSVQHTYLRREGDLLGFTHDIPFELDLDVVNNALTAGRIDAYRAAADVDRGAFLAGFALPDAPAFDTWTSLQTQYWQQKMDTVYGELSRLYCDRHNTSAAIEVAMHWVARDLLHEAAHRRLIQTYLLAGDRERAWQTFVRCRDILAAELDVEPDPATLRLAAQIKRGAVLPKPAATPAHAPIEPIQLPFTGRQTEFSHLAAHFHRMAGGEMVAAVIEGEAGIGKSHLANELLHWFALQGADVVQGRAFEAGGRLPYQALTAALRQRVEAENAPDDLVDDIWLAELSRLLPELHERYPDLPPRDTDEETAHTRLLEAIVRLLQALAARRPLVLFVDDLQWADRATLDLLHYLSRRLREEPFALLLLITVRSEDRALRSAIQEWLHTLGRVAPLISVRLGPLDAADTGQLVAALALQMEQTADAEEATVAAGWLYAETAGQPFYLAETIDMLVAQGWLRERTWFDLQAQESASRQARAIIPPGIQQMLTAKLSRLSSPARHLLVVAAVVGRPLAFEALCRLADLPEMHALDALDEARHLRLLVELETPAPLVQITHDNIRDVVYESAGATRRQVLHRRVLAQLETEKAPPAELAYHAGQAGLDADCFTYSLAAGEQALRLFALDVALEQFGRAQALLERLSLPLDSLTRLCMQMGRAYELQNDWKAARAIYLFLAEQARSVGSLSIEATALNRLGLVAAQGMYDLDQAREYLETARRKAEEANDIAQVAESTLNLAQISMFTWEARAMVEYGQSALEAARQLALAETEARALNIVAYGYLARGAYAAMEKTASQAVDLFTAQGNRALAADSLSLVCCAALHGGRWQAACAMGRQSWESSLDLASDWGIANAAIFYAHALLEAGQWGEALAVAQEGCVRARSAGTQSLTALTALTLADVYAALQAREEAKRTYHAALTLGRTVDHPFFVEWACAGLCVVHLAEQKMDDAAAFATEAQAMRRRVSGITAFAGLYRHTEVETLLRADNRRAAKTSADQFASALKHEDTPRLRLVWLQIRAAQARPADHVAAIAALQDALVLAERLDLLGEQANLHSRVAALYRAEHAPEQAATHSTQAHRVRQRLAARVDTEPWRGYLLRA